MTEIEATIKVDHKGNIWLFVPKWATRTKIIPSYWNKYVEDFALCPRCNIPMKPMYRSGDPKAGLDFFTCPKCGKWLKTPTLFLMRARP